MRIYAFDNPMWWDEAGNLYLIGSLAYQGTIVVRISSDFEREVVLRLEDGQSLIVAFQEPFNDTDWMFLQPDIYQQPEESEFELVNMSRQQFVHYQSDFEIVIPKTWVMFGFATSKYVVGYCYWEFVPHFVDWLISSTKIVTIIR